MADVTQIAQYFKALKTYFPGYVAGEFTLDEVCEGNDLNKKDCKQLGKELGRDFFTEETDPKVPKVDYRKTVQVDKDETKGEITQGDLSYERNSTCIETIEFQITKLEPESMTVFGGYSYARARTVTTCDVQFYDRVFDIVIDECQSKESQPSKGLYKFDPETQEVPEYMLLEQYPKQEESACPLILQPGAYQRPI